MSDKILAARRKLQKLNDFIDVTPEISVYIGVVWNKALVIEPDGSLLDQLVDKIFTKYATQTFH